MTSPLGFLKKNEAGIVPRPFGEISSCHLENKGMTPPYNEMTIASYCCKRVLCRNLFENYF